MRHFFKKLIPKTALETYKKWKKNKATARFANRPMAAIFTDFYLQNEWGSKESISGTGSNLAQTEALRNGLEAFFREYDIRSILDAPCGDFNWMRTVNLTDIQYTGADIVAPLIAANQANHGAANIHFQVLDIAKDALPKADLFLCRDCLVHFSYKDIFQTLENIGQTGFRFALFTSFDQHLQNADIATGDWRPLNLEIAPFFLKPIAKIDEQCSEAQGAYKDKKLILIAY